MINATDSAALVHDGPLTHRAYTAFSVCKALQTGRTPLVHVQLRRKGVTLCGQVAEMVENFDQVGQANRAGQEWFKVDCALGRVWVESRNLRLCSGDGRCSCEVAS